MVMKQFLTDFTEEELKSCIRLAYDEKFDTEAIAPLANVDGTYYLELFHGPTIAFKDMALSILPHLMTTAAKKQGVDGRDCNFDRHLRRYRKSSAFGFCGCGRDENHRLLSERWSQRGAKASNGDTERKEYSGCRHSR